MTATDVGKLVVKQLGPGVVGDLVSSAGTAIGAVGKGLGAISGAWKGAKDQFQKGF